MASAILLEKSVLEEFPEIEKDIGEDVVYSGNRLSAAARFARDVVRMNQRKITGRIGNLLCYSTTLNSFVYGLLRLRYSNSERGYVFDLKPEDRLGVVG